MSEGFEGLDGKFALVKEQVVFRSIVSTSGGLRIIVEINGSNETIFGADDSVLRYLEQWITSVGDAAIGSVLPAKFVVVNEISDSGEIGRYRLLLDRNSLDVNDILAELSAHRERTATTKQMRYEAKYGRTSRGRNRFIR